MTKIMMYKQYTLTDVDCNTAKRKKKVKQYSILK